MSSERKKLHQLFFPIFFEILCAILTGAVDTLMLATEGDQAVGAVGTANTYISVFVIMFSIISSGMVAVIMTAVELCQLFTLRGFCEIDDLMLNLLGAAMGWAIAKWMRL